VTGSASAALNGGPVRAGTQAAPVARQDPQPAPPGGARWPIGLILPVLLAIAWEAAIRAGVASGHLMPPPSRLAHTAWRLAVSGDLALHVAATLGRVGLGFAAGAVAGTLAGILTGASATARRLLDPSVQAIRAIPSIAWVPLFILWFGIFEASKLALIGLGVFFPVYLGMLTGIQSVDRKLVEVGRVFGLSPLGIALRITWPAALPAWIAALRTGLGLGFMFVVAAELMGASEGLGYLLLDGQQMGRADSILVAMIAFAVVGKLCDALLVAASIPLLRWQDTVRQRL
jgi:sulfonate transport system permease protein